MGTPKVPTSGFGAEDSQQAGLGEGRKRAEVLESSSSYSKDQVYQAYGSQPSEAAVGICRADWLSGDGFSQHVWGVPGTWGSQSACPQHTDVHQQPAGAAPGRLELSATMPCMLLQ